MANSQGTIRYMISAENRQFLGALDQVRQKSKGAFGEANNAALIFSNTLKNQVATSLALVGASLGAGQITQYADNWTDIGNKIASAGEELSKVPRLQMELLELSNKTRARLGDTADLYQKITLSSKQLGLNEEKRLRLTETINKAFTLSGTGQTQKSGALVQIGQGFGSSFQSEELNSVVDASAILRDALLKEFNVNNIKALKELAAVGEVTGARVAKAWLDATDDIDEAFTKTRSTVEKSLTVLDNSFMALVGNLDRSTGASQALSTIIIGLAENLETFIKLIGVAATAWGTYKAVNIGSIIAAEVAAIIASQRAMATAAATTQVWTGYSYQATVATTRLTAAQAAMAAVTNTASTAMRGFGAAIAANPIGFLITVTLTAISVYQLFGTEINELITGQNSLAEAQKKVNDTTDEIETLMRKAATQTGELRKKTLLLIEAKQLERRAFAQSSLEIARSNYLMAKQAAEAERMRLSIRGFMSPDQEINFVPSNQGQIDQLKKELDEAAAKAVEVFAGMPSLDDVLTGDGTIGSATKKFAEKYTDMLVDVTATAKGKAIAEEKRQEEKRLAMVDEAVKKGIIRAEQGEKDKQTIRAKSAENIKAIEDRYAKQAENQSNKNKRAADKAARQRFKDEKDFAELEAKIQTDKFAEQRAEEDKNYIVQLAKIKEFRKRKFKLTEELDKMELDLKKAHEDRKQKIDQEEADYNFQIKTDYASFIIEAETDDRKKALAQENLSYETSLHNLKKHFEENGGITKEYYAAAEQMKIAHEQRMKAIEEDFKYKASGDTNEEKLNDLFTNKKFNMNQMDMEGMGNDFINGFETQLIGMIERSQAAMEGLGGDLANIFGPGGDLQKGLAEAAARSVVFGDSFKDSLHQIGQQITATIISKLIEVGLQMATNYAMSLAFGTASTVTALAQGTAIAAAFAPAAAMVSLATGGSNAIPAQIGIGSTVALSKGLALTGLAAGGNVTEGNPVIVGEGGREVYVPGGNGRIIPNHVMRNMPNLMDAFLKMDSLNIGNAGGMNQKIIINNNAPGVDVSQRQLTGSDVELIVSSMVPDIMAQERANNYSQFNRVSREKFKEQRKY